MIRQSLIAPGLLASACGGAPESAWPAREDGALRIAAWNIEHLTAKLGASKISLSCSEFNVCYIGLNFRSPDLGY